MSRSDPYRRTLTGRVVYDRKIHRWSTKDLSRIINAVAEGHDDLPWWSQLFEFIDKLLLRIALSKLGLGKYADLVYNYGIMVLTLTTEALAGLSDAKLRAYIEEVERISGHTLQLWR